VKILSADEMRAVDRQAIEEFGIPEAALMENAGRAVADAIAAEVDDLGARRILIVCGRGNNGGDGLVAARHLLARGARPHVLLLGEVDALRSDLVRAHARALRGWGTSVDERPTAEALASVAPFDSYDLVVDAIFGTGFRPPARGFEGAAITRIRDAHRAGVAVVAVDLPSGLDADLGAVEEPAAAARVTVTFAAPKLVHWLAPADARCGRVVVADISIPQALVDDRRHRVDLFDESAARAILPIRRADSHKGTFGHLLIVAGSVGKTGAAILAGRAALRAGAGLVTIATPASCLAMVARGAAELMTEPLPETAAGALAADAAGRVAELMTSRTALAIGPGLSTDPDTVRFVRELLPTVAQPTVVDADGLNAIAGAKPADIAGPPLILTPHPGEAARLLDRTTAAIGHDRIGSARTIAARFTANVILKGHRSVVADPDGSTTINPTGNPGLASAGTGDVLTGVVGALLAQGLTPNRAARLGAWLHGVAGDRAAARHGRAGLVAGDVVEALPAAIQGVAAR